MKNIGIITGASSGIGKEFLLSIPKDKEYDEIWIMARSKNRLEELQTLTDRKLVVLAGDLTDNQVIEALSAKLEEEKPCVKLLINCSGYGKFGKTGDIDVKESLGMIDLNCKALTAVTLACLPYMDKGSEVLQIASISGFQSLPYLNVYAASKAYVLSFSRALMSEYKSQGIKVIAVCPYWTKTEFFARADTKEHDVIKRYFVLYDPKKVVKKAWRDLKRGRAVSSYGFFNKLMVFFMKFMPNRFNMWVWKKVQGLK